MSPKNVHLIFALLCLWVSCGDIEEKNAFPAYHFSSSDLQYDNSTSSLIIGIPEKIIIENISEDIDSVSVFWPRPAVKGTVSLFKSSHQPGDAFQVGQTTEVAYELIRPTGEREIATFFIEVKKS